MTSCSLPSLQIYHATCHREATTSASSLVTRLKSEFGTGSRASTPEVNSSRFTPPFVRRSPSRSPLSSPPRLIGTKRKFEHEPTIMAGHTPPVKKLALA